jgi:hypothetical protein
VLHCYVSENPCFVSETLPVSITGGLPRIIPGSLRLSLRSKDRMTMRAVLSVCSVYRIIKIPGKTKLETITDPFKGQSESLPFYEIKEATSELRNENSLDLKPIRLRCLSTAGPNHKVSM